MIMFTILGIGLVFFMVLYVTKQVYMVVQWKKLEKEVLKVNSEHMSMQELMFEYDYLKQRELELREIETSLFPYLKSKRRSHENFN